MSSPGYWGAGGADLSTVDANPSVYGTADMGLASDISTIGNTAGQWGATIASIVTGNPVATVGTPNGPRAIGAAGSTYQTSGTLGGMSGNTILLLVVVLVVGVLIFREE